MSKRIGTMAVLAAAFLCAGAVAKDGAAIIKDSELRTKSTTEKTVYRMDLIDGGGKIQQSREIALFFKKAKDSETTLFKFTSPAVVQGTGLLIEDSGKAVNDIWMYLPSTRRIRRIAGAEKSNWFMGTEFTHEDFEDYKTTSYSFKFEREEACGDKQQCLLVEATPLGVEREASGYARKVYWIDKASLYPIRIDYIGKDGAPVKRLEVQKLARFGQYWRPTAYEMHNLANRRVTRLTALSREVDGAVDDYHVSQRYLRAE